MKLINVTKNLIVLLKDNEYYVFKWTNNQQYLNENLGKIRVYNGTGENKIRVGIYKYLPKMPKTILKLRLIASLSTVHTSCA